MSEEEFIKQLNNHNIKITSLQLTQLKSYYEMIVEYNNHTNITAITNKEDVYLKHFYDSITPMFYYEFTNQTLLDIGTGAGLPGIVLKILNPSLEVTLLDSNNKKTIFLEQVINKLSLENVTIINDRCESYIKNKRESFDVVIARAVKDMSILSELALPFVKVHGCFIAMKGINNGEVTDCEHYLNILGGRILSVNNFNLINNDLERTIIIIDKETKCNTLYPRDYSKIVKKPLK